MSLRVGCLTACSRGSHQYLFKESRLCVSLSSMHELLVHEAHEGRLIGHFGVVKTFGCVAWAFLLA